MKLPKTGLITKLLVSASRLCDDRHMARERFFGYSSDPAIVGQSIESAVKQINAKLIPYQTKTWPQVFKFGEFIDSNILGAIDRSELCYFDVSVPNFNVFFEAGYSIGRGKPTIILINSSLENGGEYLQEIGLFDTIGQGRFENSAGLLEIIGVDELPRPILPTSYEANNAQPLYVLKSKKSFEGMAKAVSALIDAAAEFRVFDPVEDPRMSLRDVVDQVAQSTGVLCAVISRAIDDSESHNLRAAFLCGLARAMDREVLLLNMSTKPLPLDVRDYGKNAQDIESINGIVQTFALKSLARLQRTSPTPAIIGTGPIQRISLGASAAENESRRLDSYFVETPAFRAAMEGEGRIVVGRKGSGKTAIFSQMGETLSNRRKNLIISLRPEGYQLKKFKDNLISFLSEGTKEHTVAAFWEYALLLEICYRCIVADEGFIGRDPEITRLLPPLRDCYGSDEFVIEGDFSERTLLLLNEIHIRSKQKVDKSQDKSILSRADITELIYRHDIKLLRKSIFEYLTTKENVVILIDNLDKGWSADGVSDDDLLMLRSLIEVGRKIERNLTRNDVDGLFLIFLRNDIYELLLDATPDRGKEGKIAVDWRDRDLLKQLLNKRLQSTSVPNLHWGRISSSHIQGKPSLDWVIDRCLMRPRYLIELVSRCLGSASAKGHDRIEEDDFIKGFAAFSQDILINTNLELRDVHPEFFDAVFALRGMRRALKKIDISLALLERGFDEDQHAKIIEILIWYAVLGVSNKDGTTTFIYDVDYNSHMLEQIREARDEDGERFIINDAFVPALNVIDVDGAGDQIELL